MRDDKILRAIGGIDDALIERATPESPLPRLASARVASSRWVKWVVPAAACVAIAFVSIIGYDFKLPADGNEEVPHVGSQSGDSPGTSAQITGEPAATVYPLTINKAEMGASASDQYAADSFEYELTDEQLAAVFPNFPGTLTAIARYSGEGALLHLVAVETLEPHRMESSKMFDDMYYTTVTVGEGEIREDTQAIYVGDEPKISDVDGVEVTAFSFEGNKNDGAAFFSASFKIGDVAYRVEIHDSDSGDAGEKRLTQLVNDIIQNGAADLSVLANPVIPEYRQEELTFAQAQAEPDFGAFIPASGPQGFALEFASISVNQRENCLTAHWGRENAYFQWRVSELTDYAREHVVSVDEREKYDLSLYPIPRADSVPDDLRTFVDHPVFLAEEMSLDVIKARSYYRDEDRGDIAAWQSDFSVLLDGVEIEIDAKGVSPEELWEIVRGVVSP